MRGIKGGMVGPSEIFGFFMNGGEWALPGAARQVCLWWVLLARPFPAVPVNACASGRRTIVPASPNEQMNHGATTTGCCRVVTGPPPHPQATRCYQADPHHHHHEPAVNPSPQTTAPEPRPHLAPLRAGRPAAAAAPPEGSDGGKTAPEGLHTKASFRSGVHERGVMHWNRIGDEIAALGCAKPDPHDSQSRELKWRQA
jgi:hypothetical protein